MGVCPPLPPPPPPPLCLVRGGVALSVISSKSSIFRYWMYRERNSFRTPSNWSDWSGDVAAGAGERRRRAEQKWRSLASLLSWRMREESTGTAALPLWLGQDENTYIQWQPF